MAKTKSTYKRPLARFKSVLRQDEIQPPSAGNGLTVQPGLGRERCTRVFGDSRRMEIPGTTDDDLISTFMMEYVYSISLYSRSREDYQVHRKLWKKFQ